VNRDLSEASRSGVSLGMKQRYVIVLVHLDMEHGDVPDLIQSVGKRGSVVDSVLGAKRFRSLKLALDAAQEWAWYADVVRVVAVE
jgi:hypothetical protein